MAIFGGFMTLLSIVGFFLTVIWFVLPFVIFSIKGKVDHTLLLVEDIDRRLAILEERTRNLQPPEPVVFEAVEPERPAEGGEIL